MASIAQAGIDLFGKGVTGVKAFNNGWFLPILVIGLTLLIITRDINKWKRFMLPVTAMWGAGGLLISPVVYIFGAILYVVEMFSIEAVGATLRAATNTIQESYSLQGAKQAGQGIIRGIKEGPSNPRDWALGKGALPEDEIIRRNKRTILENKKTESQARIGTAELKKETLATQRQAEKQRLQAEK